MEKNNYTYISIYENNYEVAEYLYNKNMLSDDDKIAFEENRIEDIDLLSIFEGDPDYIETSNDWHDYFIVYEDDKMVIHTLESFDKSLLNKLKEFVEFDPLESPWTKVYNENYGTDDNPMIYYRGGIGYTYSQYKYVKN